MSDLSSSPDLSGQTAVITGAGGGIGQTICETLAREGADIIAVDKRPDLEAVVHAVEAHGQKVSKLTCDITDPEEVESLSQFAIAEHDTIDILVTCHGVVNSRSNLGATALSEWESDLAVNLTGTFLVLRSFYNHLVENGEGKIVCVGSIAAENGGLGNKPGYAAAKGGIHSLVKTVASEAANHGVYVNAVAPALIETDLTDGKLDVSSDYAPLDRLGKPEDVAQGVLFLASQQSNWITGTILEIDGGRSVR